MSHIAQAFIDPVGDDGTRDSTTSQCYNLKDYAPKIIAVIVCH
jgi:hypothetical protein